MERVREETHGNTAEETESEKSEREKETVWDRPGEG